MGLISGQKEYQSFKEGKKLSAKQSIKAQCFTCNGEEEGSNVDCQGSSCPLYPFFRKWSFKGRMSILRAEDATSPLNKTVGMEVSHV